MEEFRDLDPYYSVSNLGNIYSKRNDIILKKRHDKKGYEYITLNHDGVKKSYQVHRLVAKLFIPNPNNYPIVNHKDENPSNNSVDNLEWCSYSYNLSYGNRIQKEHKTKITTGACNAPKLVAQIDLKGNIIRIFSSAYEAGKVLHIGNSHIIDCCNNKVIHSRKGSWVCRTAGGFKFSWI